MKQIHLSNVLFYVENACHNADLAGFHVTSHGRAAAAESAPVLIDGIHSMSNPSELQTRLARQTGTCGWSIAKTAGLGLAAGALALFGQHSLSAARPIFPFIEQNFGLWQSAYFVTELVIALVWGAAMLQKINRFQESLKQLRMQQSIDRQKEASVQRRAAARRVETVKEKTFVPKATRSTKFDY